jgi:WD40 repeat protein
MGNFITIENINDPHDQKFLRAHDMPVTVLAVSPSGELLASGQVGTTRYKGNAAPVFVWSTVTGRRMTALRGDIDPSLSRLTILQESHRESTFCNFRLTRNFSVAVAM